MRQRINDQWLTRGVTMWSPANTYVDADVELAAEVSLLPGTVLRGRCVVASGAEIGPNAMLRDVEVGENAVIGTIEATKVRIGADARVGSFVVLAPGADVAPGEVLTASSPPTH
jgi:bifunctional UDP-N-acetylglucosamine pyrophosphorylase/glucosamine-1-phosphate N-acetyltransferase